MNPDLRTIRNVMVFFMVIVVLYLMKVLSSLIVPLLLAFFIALLLYPMLSWFDKRGWPGWLGMLVTIVVSLGALLIVGETLNLSVHQFISEKEELGQRLSGKLSGYGLSLADINDKVRAYIAEYDFSNFLSSLGGQLTSLLGSSFSVLIYLFVVLGGLLNYKAYFRDVENKENGPMLQVFEEVKSAITVYMGVKFVMSLGTGICFAIICWAFGVDFAFFWGFMAFCLNFIPTIGSIIATIPCVVFGLLYLDAGMLTLFGVLLGGVQITFGNIIEPKYLDNKLSINVMAILVGLVFWGYIFGIVGALLSVPLLVLSKLILKRVSGAETLARLL